MESHTKANREDNFVDKDESLEHFIGIRLPTSLYKKLLIKSQAIRRKKSETVRLAIEAFTHQTNDP